ncbi:glycosyltransferase family 4 protein [Methanophagales archaeon]|nr:MAG: glycosyltransferase family 4 protein [Methanophagales archaeon]
MKIAILVSHFPPKWIAGTEIATYNITKHLAKRGHEVHVITRYSKELQRLEESDSLYIHRVCYLDFPILRFFTHLFFSFVEIFKIRKDLSVIHGQMVSPCGLLAMIAGKYLQKPSITYVRGSDVYKATKLFKITIGEFVLRNSDVVIALTGDMKREIQKIYGREVFVIPNGIDLEKFNNLSKENVRKKLKIANEEEIIVFVGTLRSVKGIKYLIEAMKIIIQKNIDTRLMLVGDGEDRESLEKHVKELDLEKYVSFVGKVPNEKVPEYMVASDVFVLPSVSEGFPVTILEAMASGLPIVATKVGGLPEIIKDGENGFLVEPKNPKGIAQRVMLILEDDNLSGRISRNNRECVKKYSWGSVIERLEEVYKS